MISMRQRLLAKRARAKENEVLQTLRRLPRAIVLDVASRELDLHTGNNCLLGWAMRASLAHACGQRDAGERSIYDPAPWMPGGGWWGPPEALRVRYGGELGEWEYIYQGVVDSRKGIIERAWLRRVDELVRVAA